MPGDKEQRDGTAPRCYETTIVAAMNIPQPVVETAVALGEE
jgi:hypothetical protein